MTSSGPDQTPAAASGDPAGPLAPEPGAGSPEQRRRPDLDRLRRADHVIAAGTLLYLVFALIPWFHIDRFDLGWGYSFPGASANGFDSGLIVTAFVLLLLATAWALLPAVADVPVPFPRSSVTAGLAALAVLLTLIEWLTTLELGFTLMGLLTVLSAVAVAACAALRLLGELEADGGMPGLLSGATRWASGPAPRLRRGGRSAERPGGGS